MESRLDQPQFGSSPGHDQAKSTVASRICVIALGGESFAIDLRHVGEVFELESVTPVPGMPASLVGVANLRGTVVPLTDLRPALGVSVATTPKYAVVVRQDGRQVGILIDEVPEIRTIHADDLLVDSARAITESRPFLSGLVKIEGRMSGMVEISRLLASIEGTIH